MEPEKSEHERAIIQMVYRGSTAVLGAWLISYWARYALPRDLLILLVIGTVVGWYGMYFVGIPVYFLVGAISDDTGDPQQLYKRHVVYGSCLMAIIGGVATCVLLINAFKYQDLLIALAMLICVAATVAILAFIDMQRAKREA